MSAVIIQDEMCPTLSTSVYNTRKQCVCHSPSPVVQALEDQIKGDFAKVTGFGDKAGFLPPVKVPHM